MHGGIQKSDSFKEHYDHNEIFWKREKISKSQRDNFCKAEGTQYSYCIKKFKLERVWGLLGASVWGEVALGVIEPLEAEDCGIFLVLQYFRQSKKIMWIRMKLWCSQRCHWLRMHAMSHAGGHSRPFKSSFGIMCSASYREGTKCATDLI